MSAVPLVVGALVTRRQQGSVYALCFRRSHRPGVQFPGMWCFPGGKPERGESLMQALVRELAEETGVCAITIAERCRLTLAPPVVRSALTLVYFDVHAYERDPDHVPEEDTSIAWVPWKTLVQGDAAVFTPGTLALVERIEAEGGLL